jgi:hypothetical protein
MIPARLEEDGEYLASAEGSSPQDGEGEGGASFEVVASSDKIFEVVVELAKNNRGCFRFSGLARQSGKWLGGIVRKEENLYCLQTR